MASICVKSNNLNILKSLKDKLFSCCSNNIIVRDHKFKNFDNIVIHCSSENLENFYSDFCSSLSDIIVHYFEPLLVKRLISLNYFYFNHDDVDIILDEFSLLKEKNVYDSLHVKSILFSSIYDYIIQNKILVVTGFVNFRLKKYVEYLEKLVCESVNQYIIDKEYINFVNLLKSYIDSKIPNDLALNLIYLNYNGLLLSEKGNLIELEPFSNSYLSDISFSQNDYILNTLIGLVPSRIQIHLISPKDEFIKTIELIFGSKVSFCEDCDLCKAYKVLKLK